MISIFEGCAIIAVILFAILSVFIVRTLISLQNSLKDMHHLSGEIKHKLHLMESTFNTISALGEIGEDKVKNYYQEELYQRESQRKHFQKQKEHKDNYSEDFLTLILSAIKIGSKYFRG